LPVYIKRAFRDNPLFTDSKIVVSIYNDDFEDTFSKEFANKIKYDGIDEQDLKHYKKGTFVNIMKAAIDFSDGVIIGHPDINPELTAYLSKTDKPVLQYKSPEEYIDAYDEFYDELLVNVVLASD
jgi:starch synthase